MTGVGPNGARPHAFKVLLNGHFNDGEAKEAFNSFSQVGVNYLNGKFPAWLRRHMGAGLLTPLIKSVPIEGQPVDARPVNAGNWDTRVWCQALQRFLTPKTKPGEPSKGVRKHLEPQQLAVGVSSGGEALGVIARLLIERATEHGEEDGTPFAVVAIDLVNAHNAFSRRKTQHRLNELAVEDPGMAPLSRAFHAINSQPNHIYIRSSTTPGGLSHLCESRAGGGQGNPLTNIFFTVAIDKILKSIESEFPKVVIRAIQDDINVFGPAELLFGEDGAIQALLSRLEEWDLRPNRKKFQCYAIGQQAVDLTPSWLTRPFVITDPELEAQVKELEKNAKETEAEARTAPGETKATKQATADQAAREAEEARAAIPENVRAHGIKICGAYYGTEAFIETKLKLTEREICSIDLAEPGTILRVATKLAAIDPHVANSAALYSLQARLDYIMATHPPSLTGNLARAADEAMKRSYETIFGTDILNPEGVPNQKYLSDTDFTRDRAYQPIRHNGLGARLHETRCQFLNTMNAVLRQMPSLCPDLTPITGDSWGEPTEESDEAEPPWRTFLASGSKLAEETKSEWNRMKSLKDEALAASHGDVSLFGPSPFDAEDDSFGGGEKLQKRIFDFIYDIRANALLRRAENLMTDDPRRMAFLACRGNPFPRSLLEYTPSRECSFNPTAFRCAVQMLFGIPVTILEPYLGLPIKTNRNSCPATVDPEATNLKARTNVGGGFQKVFHDFIQNWISLLCHRAGIEHIGGSWGRPSTCKNLFEFAAIAIARATGCERLLNYIIPDLLINYGNTRKMIDFKTLGPGMCYSESNSIEEGIVIETRAKKVTADYTKKAKEIDRANGTAEGAIGHIEFQFKKYNEGNVLGFVIGAYGDLSKNFSELTDFLATQKAKKYLQYHNTPFKDAKSMFLRQLRHTLGLVAHHGAATLLLNRLHYCVESPRNPPNFNEDRNNDSAHYHHFQFDHSSKTDYGPRAESREGSCD